MEEVQITTTAGRILNGNIFRALDDTGGAKPAALLIHGWTSGQDRMFDMAEALSMRSGITCLTIDLGGHGKSEGKIGELSRKDFLDDVLAAYDFLVAQPNVDMSKIGALGSSFGAWLAAMLTAERKVNWVVMRVPADYPDDDFETPKQVVNEEKGSPAYEWRTHSRSWDATAALRAIHNFRGKVLLVESENDELIPSQLVQNFANAVVEKRDLRHEIMKGASHSITRTPEHKAKFVEIVLDWEKQKSSGSYTTVLN
jgi:esterase/lipase